MRRAEEAMYFVQHGEINRIHHDLSDSSLPGRKDGHCPPQSLHTTGEERRVDGGCMTPSSRMVLVSECNM